MVFFQVMAQFIVPMFLACVLLVVFQPLHRWILRRLPTYPRISALITTVLILLAVLLPLVWLGWNAYGELHSLFGPKEVAAEAAAPNAKDSESDPEKLTDEKNKDAEPELSTELKKVENDFIRTIAFQIRNDLYKFTDFYIQDEKVTEYVRVGK